MNLTLLRHKKLAVLAHSLAHLHASSWGVALVRNVAGVVLLVGSVLSGWGLAAGQQRGDTSEKGEDSESDQKPGPPLLVPRVFSAGSV